MWLTSLGAVAKVLRIVWQDLVYLCKDMARRKRIETTTANANATVAGLFNHQSSGTTAGTGGGTKPVDGL